MTAENNIHAGVKFLQDIADAYFSDPKIDPVELPAAHLCGVQRRPQSHRRSSEGCCGRKGSIPNRWFGNVELLVSQRVGQTTVQYVSNIYKYYVAYKLVVEQGQTLQ